MNMNNWLTYLNANSDEEKSKVIKFIILWMAYNQWYNEAFPKMSGDKNKALQLGKNHKACVVYEDLKAGFLDTFKKIPSVHCEDGQRDCLWKDSEKEILFDARNCDLKQFLTLIYQIRCNFFHGNKEYDDVNLKLIIWAYETLHMFVKKVGIILED